MARSSERCVPRETRDDVNDDDSSVASRFSLRELAARMRAAVEEAEETKRTAKLSSLRRASARTRMPARSKVPDAYQSATPKPKLEVDAGTAVKSESRKSTYSYTVPPISKIAARPSVKART